MFKHFNHISEKRSDGSLKWKKVDHNGKPSIWEEYKKDHAWSVLIRNTKPIVLEDKKKINKKDKSKAIDDSNM